MSFEVFNFLEGIYWLTLGGLAAAVREISPLKYKTLALFAASVFVLFGITDFIEIGTGAYWDPWWLYAWNICCVVGLVVSLAWYVKLRFIR